MSDSAAQRLAVYGTLAPGGPNEHHLAGMAGSWTPGSVRGHLYPDGWGAALGYPGIVLDPHGPAVPVQVFDSPDLPDHWERLDTFEGPGYRRVPVQVTTGPGGDASAEVSSETDGGLTAMIYALAAAPDATDTDANDTDATDADATDASGQTPAQAQGTAGG
ncbi:gamma-glutamylcyclotransferase (GGCT)/AIG2-like uncharacterized protein YtfP [Kineosphaera limosa]|uniref:Gamma-glutamylcyclotransferase AIG2-like domain-containing protein n=1 Tax=Kineosphaera limosa NBRC 100340 TaxID=1184609 RepID=K6WS03_9MICO|nr:gamma-glutamylcyclotransferase family protein [Kineosphaera limosa]NYE00952.1 gamma-glutamylcyclotransferase (GGCT)/AIG2-like uncharacterized protein YtfP [Kineosphaera limosa]GAB94852.1 hypothetical protein KILIM_013_00070 [Kineosphaera limosa NBRC 100340]